VVVPARALALTAAPDSGTQPLPPPRSQAAIVGGGILIAVGGLFAVAGMALGVGAVVGVLGEGETYGPAALAALVGLPTHFGGAGIMGAGVGLVVWGRRPSERPGLPRAASPVLEIGPGSLRLRF
jgi:hypothetical protein